MFVLHGSVATQLILCGGILMNTLLQFFPQYSVNEKILQIGQYLAKI